MLDQNVTMLGAKCHYARRSVPRLHDHGNRLSKLCRNHREVAVRQPALAPGWVLVARHLKPSQTFERLRQPDDMPGGYSEAFGYHRLRRETPLGFQVQVANDHHAELKLSEV